MGREWTNACWVDSYVSMCVRECACVLAYMKKHISVLKYHLLHLHINNYLFVLSGQSSLCWKKILLYLKLTALSVTYCSLLSSSGNNGKIQLNWTQLFILHFAYNTVDPKCFTADTERSIKRKGDKYKRSVTEKAHTWRGLRRKYPSWLG